MQRLGQEIAEEYKETIVQNIEENKFGFSIKEGTLRNRGDGPPLMDTRELVDAIYREGTTVSVEDTPRSDSSLSNLELAMVHEYGTKDKHIPARPVWRQTYREFRPLAKQQIEDFLNSKGKFKTQGIVTAQRTSKKK